MSGTVCRCGVSPTFADRDALASVGAADCFESNAISCCAGVQLVNGWLEVLASGLRLVQAVWHPSHRRQTEGVPYRWGSHPFDRWPRCDARRASATLMGGRPADDNSEYFVAGGRATQTGAKRVVAQHLGQLGKNLKIFFVSLGGAFRDQQRE
jgi:hypothetical protein